MQHLCCPPVRRRSSSPRGGRGGAAMHASVRLGAGHRIAMPRFRCVHFTPSILLSFSLATVLPRRVVSALAARPADRPIILTSREWGVQGRDARARRTQPPGADGVRNPPIDPRRPPPDARGPLPSPAFGDGPEGPPPEGASPTSPARLDAWGGGGARSRPPHVRRAPLGCLPRFPRRGRPYRGGQRPTAHHGGPRVTARGPPRGKASAEGPFKGTPSREDESASALGGGPRRREGDHGRRTPPTPFLTPPPSTPSRAARAMGHGGPKPPSNGAGGACHEGSAGARSSPPRPQDVEGGEGAPDPHFSAPTRLRAAPFDPLGSAAPPQDPKKVPGGVPADPRGRRRGLQKPSPAVPPRRPRGRRRGTGGPGRTGSEGPHGSLGRVCMAMPGRRTPAVEGPGRRQVHGAFRRWEASTPRQRGASGARRRPPGPVARSAGPGAHARPCTGSGREAGLPGGAPGEPIRAARVAAPGETPRSSRGGQLMGGTTGIRRLRTPPRGPPSAATRAEGGAPRPLPRHARDPEGTPTPQGRARARRIPTPQGRGLPRTPKAASEGAARGEGPPARRRPSEGPPWGADGPNGRGRPRRRPPRAPRGPRGRRRGNRQGPVPRSEAPSRVPGRGPHGEGPTRGRGVLREDPTPEGVGGRTTPPVPGVQGDV